jgi:cytoskeletal protein CcmA (bactofilin family)
MWDHDKKDCSVIGADLIVSGEIKCKSDLMIEGRVEGNISCVSLFVGKSGIITGDISTEEVLVEGTVHGMISSGSVELKDGCSLLGDISSQTLAIDHGAEFTGSVRPVKEAIKPNIKEAAE